MTATQTSATQTGIVVSTAIHAGGARLNHAEGIVVATGITGGGPGLVIQHAERASSWPPGSPAAAPAS